MVVFKSKNGKFQVTGATIITTLEGFRGYKSSVVKLLKEKDLSDIKPDNWYDLQVWLDIFKTIFEQVGNSTLKVAGMKISENAKLPKGPKSIDEVIKLLDKMFQKNHKGGDLGYYKFEFLSNNKGVVTCNNPYPCSWDKGLIGALLNKYRTPGSIPKIKHLPEDCKMLSGDICKFEVIW